MDLKVMTDKEQAIKDCISIARVFCEDERKRAERLPKDEAQKRGDFITVFESDFVNQLKVLLK